MRILVLGIGNILFGDEGVGAHFAHYIDEKYDFKSQHEIKIIDGGTLAHQLIPMIVDFDEVVLIDCIENEEGEFGDVFFFDFANMPPMISWQGSAHEVETLQTLEMMRTHGDIPSIQIIGVIPRRIGSDPTFTLSQEIIQATKTMEQVLCKHLQTLDPHCQITVRNHIHIQDIAQVSFKRSMRHEMRCDDF
ncbi:HyaD/HybD family hydrogenase maturation endopeptidase [Helicobacter pametensis]|uniref:HyaD/HybD family hydrogenase maturation endopeptidase n=1 Tax=Helicobacter pametensis TaxID=95149 RepID=UPI0004856103|nr:HyaD/HybD family hydrogenase maturation endopeptidase [Helicobacter pametensis]